MTSDGSAYSRFRRALERGNAPAAWTTAAELPTLSLDDALALCLLLAREDGARYDTAAVRWHARLCREARGLSMDEAALALSALRALAGPGGQAAGHALAGICEARGQRACATVLDSWLEG